MSVNSLNYTGAEEWRGKINKIGFQFETPLSKEILFGFQD
jgi:hypothetical protein